MKKPAAAVSLLLLVATIQGVAPSNPETEIVQDPEEDSKVPVKKSEQIRSVGDRPNFVALANKYSGGVMILRPVVTDVGIVWREVTSSSGRERIRIRNRGGYLDIFRVTGGGNRTAAPDDSRPHVPTRSAQNTTVARAPERKDAPAATSTPPSRSSNLPQSPTTTKKKISPDANLFAALVNDLTFKLIEGIDRGTNFVVSPLSIFTVLAMCYLGAGGRTRDQLERVLGLDAYAVHGEHLHRGLSDLLSEVSPPQSEEDYQLFLASALFVASNLTVEEPFREDVQKFYAARMREVDFRSRQESLRAVNEWVDRATRGHISSFVENPLPAFTQLLILNAIFFKGVWQTQFPVDFTHKGPFFSLDGSEKKVPLMSLFRETFPVHWSDKHKHSFLKLPYRGGEMSMIVALPYGQGERPMPTITDQEFCHIRDALVERRLSTLSLPKFKLETLTPLVEALSRMGLRDLFDGASANLTGIRRQGDLAVSDVLHKAVIEVNEEGTTAAAASGVQIVPLSSFQDEFVVDHPFAFYVVHEASGLVLFYGKVYDLGETTPEAPPAGVKGNLRVPGSDNGRNVRRRQPFGGM